MTRRERRWHALGWLVLAPLVLLLVAAGVWQRATRGPGTVASGVGR